MIRALWATVALALVVPMSRAAELNEGKWQLSYGTTPIANFPALIIKVEKKDGKLTATEVKAQGQAKLSSFKVEGDNVTIDVAMGTRKMTFTATIGKDSKQLKGIFSDALFTARGKLTATESDQFELPNAGMQSKVPEAYAKYTKLNVELGTLQRKLIAEKDADNKAELTKQFATLRKQMQEEAPKLFRETFDKAPESPYGITAASQLINMAGKLNASPQEAGAWVKAIMTEAAEYGDQFKNSTALTTAEVLAGNKSYAAMALELVSPIHKSLKDSDPISQQVRVLKAVMYSQLNSGKIDEGKATDAKLAKLEAKLDEEYLKKDLPFTPKPFEGRKEGTSRVAVLELFTGAQCPPCVAADMAFDALEKSYKATDLVLIQYHMHIPGPDPLTNPDAIARWDYYSAKFPENIRGTPSTLFNGQPKSGGGGPAAFAERKFNDYKAILDQTIAGTSSIKFTGEATLKGDKLNINVAVTGVDKPGANTKLRLVLVEDTVRYLGGNGLRFHHHVVRALPGGADGTALKENTGKVSVEMDLNKVRESLNKYLDEFAKERPFSNLDRPMELKKLKVIAIVQDDDSREILNAAQFDVK